jgi:hypothetical protein
MKFYEKRHEPLLSRSKFYLRIVGHLAVSASLVCCSLGLGIATLMDLEQLSFHDTFLQSASVLSGLGVTEIPASPGGKLFLGWYAMYSGLFFLLVSGIILAPLLHRLLHVFHWKDEGDATS